MKKRSVKRAGVAWACAASAWLLAGCAGSDAGSGPTGAWTCEAQGLMNAAYDGSDTAFIHLSRYGNGGSYPVTLNAERTVATGTTRDGTPFRCKRVR